METTIQNNTRKWDVFISHSSDDKFDFVNSLVSSLSKFNLRVWYDDDQLLIGDSISKSIDYGLTKSLYGVLVITRSFIRKRWPEYEYRSLLMREINGRKVILPIWHNIDVEEVLEYSPYLADKYAFNSSIMSTDQIAFGILKVIDHNIANNICRYLYYKQLKNDAKTEHINVNSIHMSEIRHNTLPNTMVTRIRIIYNEVLSSIGDTSFEDVLDNFKRDLYPQDEISIWENILATGLEYFKSGGKLEKRVVYSLLLMISSGVEIEDNRFNEEEYKILLSIWRHIRLGNAKD